jgi:hypothetical protein
MTADWEEGKSHDGVDKQVTLSCIKQMQLQRLRLSIRQWAIRPVRARGRATPRLGCHLNALSKERSSYLHADPRKPTGKHPRRGPGRPPHVTANLSLQLEIEWEDATLRWDRHATGQCVRQADESPGVRRLFGGQGRTMPTRLSTERAERQGPVFAIPPSIYPLPPLSLSPLPRSAMSYYPSEAALGNVMTRGAIWAMTSLT